MYSSYLRCPEWSVLRLKIIARDNQTCDSCKCKKSIRDLRVHHQCYYNDIETPWQYEEKDLITLCDECHKAYHEKNGIWVVEVCDRCFGDRYIKEYEHIEKGICFKCWGKGIVFKNKNILC